MRIFIDIISSCGAECVKAKQKEKRRRANEKVLWKDVLEIFEDRVFKGYEKNRSRLVLRTDIDSNFFEVMIAFLNDFSENNINKNEVITVNKTMRKDEIQAYGGGE